MRKNRFYIILAILTIIFLFSFSALCNQCSAPDEDKIDVGKEEEADKTSDNAEDQEQDSDAGSESEEDNSENQDDGEDEEDDEAEAPTIELIIYEGPIYSSGDDVCYYRIKADVTGEPNPDIDFSKDDSSGAWGSKKVQINIGNPSDSYTLTATATNSEGSDSDSITLTWACNRPPLIASIAVDQDFHYTDDTYHVVVNTSDPDGDALAVTWSVSGGSISDVNSNPMNWTTPATGGDYDITVEVADGNGGTATLTETVEVFPALPPPVFNMNVSHVPAEGGYLEDGGVTNCSGCVYAGDTNNNEPCKGFMSYNISGLAGATITDAKLTFTLKKKWDDPSFYGDLYINTIYWGPTPIDQGLFGTSGTAIQGFSSSGSGSFTCIDSKLEEELQKAINDGKPRFQIRIHFAGTSTDSNSDWDGWEYDQSQVVLNVTGSY